MRVDAQLRCNFGPLAAQTFLAGERFWQVGGAIEPVWTHLCDTSRRLGASSIVQRKWRVSWHTAEPVSLVSQIYEGATKTPKPKPEPRSWRCAPQAMRLVAAETRHAEMLPPQDVPYGRSELEVRLCALRPNRLAHSAREVADLPAKMATNEA